MRLVCPNCEAKYEVPEDAIPETGRDVQCANCGHAWFQMRTRPLVAEPAPSVEVPVAPPAPPPAAEPEPAPEAPAPVAEASETPVEVVAEAATEAVTEAVTDLEPEAVPSTAEEALAETVGSSDPEPESLADELPSAAEAALAEALAAEPAEAAAVVDPPADETLAGEFAEPVAEVAPAAEAEPGPEAVPEAEPELEPVPEAEPEVAPGPAAAAYAVDESVLAILREEAEREAQARRNEARPLEVQTDLGIEAAIPAATKDAEPSAAEPVLAAASVAGEAEADSRPSARRDLLPNVEEINSTLRPSEHPVEDEAVSDVPAPEAEARSSFRSGFLVVMTVTILATALYLGADVLSMAVPALAGPLDAFVGFVDGLRLQLDGLMQNATVAINGSGG